MSDVPEVSTKWFMILRSPTENENGDVFASPPLQFFPRIPSFPHAFSGNPGAGTGPPIKTFGGDVLGVAIPSLHRQFSRSKWRLSRGIVFFRGYFSSSKSHRLALKRSLYAILYCQIKKLPWSHPEDPCLKRYSAEIERDRLSDHYTSGTPRRRFRSGAI